MPSVPEAACAARATSWSRASPAGGSQFSPTADLGPFTPVSDKQLGSGLAWGPSSLRSSPHHCQSTHKGNPASSLSHSKVCNDTDYRLDRDALPGARTCARLPSPALFAHTPLPPLGPLLPCSQASLPHPSPANLPLWPDSPCPSLSLAAHKRLLLSGGVRDPLQGKRFITLEPAMHGAGVTAMNIHAPSGNTAPWTGKERRVRAQWAQRPTALPSGRGEQRTRTGTGAEPVGPEDGAHTADAAPRRQRTRLSR